VKRQYRLRRPAHFHRVRSSGSHYDGAVLLLSSAPARQRLARCGVVVARRLGTAVVRNRIKRRIREVLRLHYPSLRAHVDIVVVARSRDLATMPFSQLRDTMLQLLRRANLWQPPDSSTPIRTDT
jgi:ribonuclease P protein component